MILFRIAFHEFRMISLLWYLGHFFLFSLSSLLRFPFSFVHLFNYRGLLWKESVKWRLRSFFFSICIQRMQILKLQTGVTSSLTENPINKPLALYMLSDESNKLKTYTYVRTKSIKESEKNTNLFMDMLI